MHIRKIAISALLATVGLSFSVAAYAETTLKAVTALPRKHPSNAPFDEFVKLVNERGKGVIAIRYIGGPDVTPVQEQMKATTSGVIDFFYGPSSYYLGEIPEAQAFNGANKTSEQIRADGGLKALEPAFNKRLNVHLLGYYGSGYTFYIYLKDKPKMDANGLPDLSGLKIRGAPTYRKFFSQMGASTVLVHIGEMYTALERGVIDGAGWLGYGVTNFGWDKVLKYRITPSYWEGDIVSVVNLPTWSKLSPEAKDILTKVAAETEISGHEHFVKLEKAESEKLKAGGMENIELKGDAAATYRRYAHDVGVWEALGENIPAEEAKALKSKLYDPGK